MESGNGNYSILLVEDDPAHAELIGRAFEEHFRPYELTWVRTLAEAQSHLVKDMTHKLIVADLMLPDGKGIELLYSEQIRNTHPFVLMTGQGSEQIAVQAILSGAQDYVVKSNESLADLPRIADQACRNWQNIILRRQAEEALHRKLLLEEHIAAISSHFVGVSDIDDAIDFALYTVGDRVDARRVLLYQKNSSSGRAICTHAWQADGEVQGIDVEPALENIHLPWSLACLQSGRMAILDTSVHLPPEAHRDLSYLEERGSERYILASISILTQPDGFLLVDLARQADTDANEHYYLLNITSEILGQALSRQGYEKAERAARTKTEVLRQAMMALSASLDLTDVLDRLLSFLDKALHFDSCAVLLHDNSQLTVVAARNLPSLQITGTFPVLLENPLFREIEVTNGAVVLGDTRVDARFEPWRAFDSSRSWIGAPLMVGGVIIGYLTLGSLTAYRYKEEEAALALSFATQAAIAIENARLFERVQELAITDSLTGLHNRRHFLQLARRELKTASRSLLPVSAIILDIDHFKLVNDNHGHAGGDQVLMKMASLLRQEVREGDIVGRLGGEEFAILLPNTELTVAKEVAEHLRTCVAEMDFIVEKKTIHTTISLGVTCMDQPSLELDILLKSADQLLYEAKESGRDAVRSGMAV